MGFETQEQLIIRKLREEVASLRAELAAERDLREREKEAAVAMLQVKIDALAAERTLRGMIETSERMKLEALEAAEAERDRLRELLREAREYTGYAAFYGDRIEADHAADLCARIDAALNKGGEDE